MNTKVSLLCSCKGSFRTSVCSKGHPNTAGSAWGIHACSGDQDNQRDGGRAGLQPLPCFSHPVPEDGSSLWAAPVSLSKKSQTLPWFRQTQASPLGSRAHKTPAAWGTKLLLERGLSPCKVPSASPCLLGVLSARHSCSPGEIKPSLSSEAASCSPQRAWHFPAIPRHLPRAIE